MNAKTVETAVTHPSALPLHFSARAQCQLAALVSVIWGFGFIAAKVALESFSAPQLTALRFIVAGLLIFIVPRPPIGLPYLTTIGLTLFTGQFLLLFFAFAHGMPPGLAPVGQQVQAVFTVGLAALFLGDIPSTRQVVGMVLALAGLGLIGLTVGADLEFEGFGLAIAAAFSWAVGNVLVKRAGNVPMFPLMVWLCAMPPVPALLVSILDGEGASLASAIAHASGLAMAAVLYLALLATIFAYAVWGKLLATYPSAMVAPFAMLAPCTGIIASAVVFGETFSPRRGGGIALVLAGLALIVLSKTFVLALGCNLIGPNDAVNPADGARIDGDPVPFVPWTVDPDWYDAYWYHPTPHQRGADGRRGLPRRQGRGDSEMAPPATLDGRR